MITYEVEINGVPVRVCMNDGMVYITADADTQAIRDFVNKVTYGVRIERFGDKVYFMPTEHSGVRPEYRDYITHILMENGYSPEEARYLAEHNQISLIVLGVIAAMGAGLAYYTWKNAGTFVQKVMFPLLALIGTAGLVIVMGKYLGR